MRAATSGSTSTWRPSTSRWPPRAAGLIVLALAAAGAADARASSWPVGGGNASRSAAQSADAAGLPVGVAWSAPGEAEVRTPPVITGGTPDVQRVAYGTADGRVHLRALVSGAEVGAPGGELVADAAFTDLSKTFGPPGDGNAFASTSTDAATGVLIVAHTDGGGVEIARFNERTGQRAGGGDFAVPSSLGCSLASSPVLTPPGPGGARLLYLTLSGRCAAGPGLVRIPVAPDASLGAPTFAGVPELSAGAPPSLMVLKDGGGAPRFYVAVGRTSGVDLFLADRAFAATPEAAPTAPDLSVELGTDDAVAAIATPATADGRVAGDVTTGALAPGGFYVLSVGGGGGARVDIVLQGSGGALASITHVAVPGAPRVGGLAVRGVVGRRGLEPDVRLAVVTSVGMGVLRGNDLAPVGGGVGGSFGAPAASGDLAFASGAGGAEAVRLSDGGAVDLPAGVSTTVAPALARGYLTFGQVTYGTSDVTKPTVRLHAHKGLKKVSATATDDRGVAFVNFRLDGRRLARAGAPASGSPFSPGALFVPSFSARSLPPGRHKLVAVARDTSNLAGRAHKRSRVSCGHREHGGHGHDVMRGGRGHDCLNGRGGADRIVGGRGGDRLVGGGGRDTLVARDGAIDVVRCGRGRDTVRADRGDRVARSCERVRRPRR